MHGSPSPRGGAARRGRSPRVPASSPAPSVLPPDFSTTAASFTSCLSIAVEGAIPIERPEPSAPATTDAPPTNDTKRAPRKSKTDALAALQTHAQSSLGEETLNDSITEEGARRVQLRDGPPMHVSPTLDLSTVKTSNTRPTGPKSGPRMFGLTDCPTFHPTLEQWKDPMAYIASISDTGKRYGMCKIVPPLGWNMPFVTDTEVRIRLVLSKCEAPIVALLAAQVSFLLMRLSPLPTEVPVQDPAAAAQFYRSVVPRKGKFPRAALSVPQAAGQSARLRSHYQSQTPRSMAVAQGGA